MPPDSYALGLNTARGSRGLVLGDSNALRCRDRQHQLPTPTSAVQPARQPANSVSEAFMDAGCHAGCFRSCRFQTPPLRQLLSAAEVMRSAGCGQHASATPKGTPAWRAASQALAPLPPRRHRLVQRQSPRGGRGARAWPAPRPRAPPPPVSVPLTQYQLASLEMF